MLDSAGIGLHRHLPPSYCRKRHHGDHAVKISARNVLKGTVKKVKTGPVNSQVTVDIGGGNNITSMITSDAVADLGLASGKAVYVVIKASEVILGTE